MAEKPTTMVLNVVDLQCSKCYKKIKKLLCKFPQIRDQTYDEKANKVTIKVVCCSPEKIRDKLCCKGGGCIKSIEIKPDKPGKPDKPDKPGKPDKPDKPGQPNKPGQPDKPDKPPPPTKPKKQQISIDLDLKSKKQQISIDLDLDLQLQCGPPPPVFRCSGCCGGRTGGPCYCGWRVHCDPCFGTPVYGSCSGYGSGCAYFTEENPQACSIV